MSISYTRKSSFDMETTIKNLKDNAQKYGMEAFGITELPGSAGKLIHVCNKKWVDEVLKKDNSLVGLIPCAILISEKDGNVLVSSGSATVVGSVSQNQEIYEIAKVEEANIRKLVHASAGVEPLKPSGVKLYSTQTCPYCTMEKKWLEASSIDHEVIYVDQDQEQARRLVEKTGQMGVPVTEIMYEDNESQFVVGFNKPALSELLLS